MRNSNPKGPRKDLSTVVVERPRGGQDGNINNRAHRRTARSKKNFEDLPSKESIHAPHKHGKWADERKVDRKDDFLSPIKGFLRKSVGRPWDKVWSELRSMLNGHTTMHQHVLDHVTRYVEVKPMFIQGRVCSAFSYSGQVPYELSNGDYYVSPHGILRRYKRPKGLGFSRPYTRSACQKLVRKNDREDYRKINGFWFLFRYEHLHHGQALYDVHLCREVRASGEDVWRLPNLYGWARHNGLRLYGTCFRACVEKRQLTKKEIRELELEIVPGTTDF